MIIAAENRDLQPKTEPNALHSSFSRACTASPSSYKFISESGLSAGKEAIANAILVGVINPDKLYIQTLPNDGRTMEEQIAAVSKVWDDKTKAAKSSQYQAGYTAIIIDPVTDRFAVVYGRDNPESALNNFKLHTELQTGPSKLSDSEMLDLVSFKNSSRTQWRANWDVTVVRSLVELPDGGLDLARKTFLGTLDTKAYHPWQELNGRDSVFVINPNGANLFFGAAEAQNYQDRVLKAK